MTPLIAALERTCTLLDSSEEDREQRRTVHPLTRRVRSCCAGDKSLPLPRKAHQGVVFGPKHTATSLTDVGAGLSTRDHLGKRQERWDIGYRPALSR